MPDNITQIDRYRCVLCVRFRVINRDTRTVTVDSWEIEIDPHSGFAGDVREDYRDPVIRYESPLTARVYDDEAVDLANKLTLLGDPGNGIARCEEALEEKGYTVFRPPCP